MQQNMMGQNIIIKEPSSNLRTLGRNSLKGKWKLAILAVIIYELCVGVPPTILNALFGTKGSIGVMQNVDVDIYNTLPDFSLLANIYIILVTGAFLLGITMLFLALFRRQQVSPIDIFLGFEHLWKALGVVLLQGLFVLLWSLLFIVPGIIASIRYSQALYILADDPSKGVRQCINESKVMMKGNKSKYFFLLLSFIGWFLLAAIPPAILEAISVSLNANDFVIGIISIISPLFLAPVTAYAYSAATGFYEILAGHLIKETEPAPVEPIVVEEPEEKQSEENKSEEENAKECSAEECSAEETVSDNNQPEETETNENDYIPKEV